MRSFLSSAKFLLWITVPVAMWAAVEFNGLPHFRWKYSWVDQGQGYDPYAYRYYTDCTFWGPYGTFTIHPADGKCAWFRLYLVEDSR